MHARTAEKFLEYLRQHVHVIDGEAKIISRDRQRGQRAFEFAEGQSLIWCINVDLVIEGGCSDAYSIDRPTTQVPLGECVKQAGKEHLQAKSWLHAVVEQHKPQSILFVPACCGQYSELHQRVIRSAFPTIEMRFPSLGDYYDNVHDRLDQVCNDLMKANVLGSE